MKAKIRSIEKILLSVVVMLNVYLVYLNISVNEFKTTNEVKENANYVEIEEIVMLESEEVKEEIIEENPLVYDGKTLEELTQTINNSLNSTISNKGYLIASYSLEKGVDPYMATAIMLHETGCKWNCSRLVRECNNVGGQKGKGCGSYSYFNSLDEGIKAFIDNLERKYISYGLTTPEQINPKYAEDRTWYKKVNKYIEEIKAQ